MISRDNLNLSCVWENYASSKSQCSFHWCFLDVKGRLPYPHFDCPHWVIFYPVHRLPLLLHKFSLLLMTIPSSLQSSFVAPSSAFLAVAISECRDWQLAQRHANMPWKIPSQPINRSCFEMRFRESAAWEEALQSDRPQIAYLEQRMHSSWSYSWFWS